MPVAPERLARWLAGFAERHGPVDWSVGHTSVTARAADGAVAECLVPFPPLRPGPLDPPELLTAHALADRRVGVLLARLGGHAAGVFDGPRLVASKVGSRHVQGRTAAGGWSQQRFARRREGQGRAAAGAAADVAVRVLLPEVTRLDAVVLGGDRRAVAAVLDDPRLAPLRGLVTGPLLDVPDPRLRVLEATPAAFRAVRVRVVEPLRGEGDSTGPAPVDPAPVESPCAIRPRGVTVPDRPSVIVFDVNETLSDMAPMADRFTEVGLPRHLAPTWFASVLRDGFALAAAGTSVPFAQIAREVLRPLLAEAAVADGDGATDAVLSGFMSLSVHPDVPDGIRALRAAGIPLVTLSNGAASVAEGLLERAGLRGQFDRLLSVEDAGIWKPARGAYAHAAQVCETPLESMMLVAVHPWDTDGAARAGMRTAFIDRTGTAYPGHFRAPEVTASGLLDLARQLGA